LPFTGVTNGDAEGKVIRKSNEASMTALKGSAMVPTLTAWQTKVSRPPLSGFTVSSTVSDDLPNARTKERFDPNAYKLMEKAGYDSQNPTILGKVVVAKPHGLMKLREKFKSRGAL